MKFFIGFLFLFLCADMAEWGNDMNKAKSTAQAENKLILLNFSGSDWCGPCIKLKEEVLLQAGFLEYAKKRLVLVNADFPRKKKNQLNASLKLSNEALAEKYNPKGNFPFTVLIDKNGKNLKEWNGYPKDLNVSSLSKEIDKLAR